MDSVKRLSIKRSNTSAGCIGHIDGGFSAAEYFDAFSTIDRSIRDLIDGQASLIARLPHTPMSAHARLNTKDQLPLDKSACSSRSTSYIKQAGDPKHKSTGSSTTAVTRSIRSSSNLAKGFQGLPPCLDELTAPNGSDEDATVAFLCSGLPHYEGTAPINYGDLSVALDAYFQSRKASGRWLADDSGNDIEEYVPESAWDCGLQQPLQLLPSPQTLSGSPRDAGVSAYEGWIDFDELIEVAQTALSLPHASRIRLGQRTETDHMLLYPIEAPGADQWIVQIPKPSVLPLAFESEIVSLAYVGEHTDLPAPSILAYEFSSSNSVGVPYAIVAQMPGVPLASMWYGLGARQKRKVLDQIADVVVQLSQMQFPLIGSLIPKDGELIIGPLLSPRQTEFGYSKLDPGKSTSTSSAENLPVCNRYGPFPTTKVYFDALIQDSLDALSLLHSESQAESVAADELSLNKIELEAYRSFVGRFADKYNEGPFVLMPESLDMHHFYFDSHTCQLTGLVDWTYASTRPLSSLAQAPSFVFDDTPRWEPVHLEARLAYRRNLVRYRQWFMNGLQKRAWAVLGKQKSDEMAQLVRTGYWRYKFEYEISESVQYSNPWTFRAIWEHLHPNEEFAVWVCHCSEKG
ncbi:hypothetical protein BX070DRAFT_234748 [Coemansia spiralis]|nr:hypothetical protein BX070DRAFT_234748 [Coemansia spiralis]